MSSTSSVTTHTPTSSTKRSMTTAGTTTPQTANPLPTLPTLPPLASLPTVKRHRSTTTPLSSRSDTTNTFYHTHNHSSPNSRPSGSDVKTHLSLFSPPARTHTTGSSSRSSQFSPPSPPSFHQPRYITPQTVHDMTRQSEDLTRKELAKLNALTSTGSTTTGSTTHSAQACSPSALSRDYTDTRLHEMMCKYADKQQEMCTQICTLNQRLQTTQDHCFALKDAHQKAREELDTECDHLKEVSNGYEDDLDELQQQHSKLEATHQTLVDDHAHLRDTCQTMRVHNGAATVLWVGIVGLLYLACTAGRETNTTSYYEWFTTPGSFGMFGMFGAHEYDVVL